MKNFTILLPNYLRYLCNYNIRIIRPASKQCQASFRAISIVAEPFTVFDCVPHLYFPISIHSKQGWKLELNYYGSFEASDDCWK